VFSDLKLVRALTPRELKSFGKEENRPSYSDLTQYHRQRQPQGGQAATAEAQLEQIENHGLLSKAERALDIANWRQKAKRDTEIFRIVETDGLTPILQVLDEMTLANSGKGDASESQSQPQPAT